MIFPEFLYKLNDRERQLTQLELVNFGLEASSAAAQVQTPNYVVPNDKILCITSVYGILQPGAGQNIRGFRAALQEATGATATTFYAEGGVWSTAVTGYSGRAWGVYVPPNGMVLAVGNFNAGAAANTVRAEFSGILIPRGTFLF